MKCVSLIPCPPAHMKRTSEAWIGSSFSTQTSPFPEAQKPWSPGPMSTEAGKGWHHSKMMKYSGFCGALSLEYTPCHATANGFVSMGRPSPHRSAHACCSVKGFGEMPVLNVRSMCVFASYAKPAGANGNKWAHSSFPPEKCYKGHLLCDKEWHRGTNITGAAALAKKPHSESKQCGRASDGSLRGAVISQMPTALDCFPPCTAPALTRALGPFTDLVLCGSLRSAPLRSSMDWLSGWAPAMSMCRAFKCSLVLGTNLFHNKLLTTLPPPPVKGILIALQSQSKLAFSSPLWCIERLQTLTHIGCVSMKHKQVSVSSNPLQVQQLDIEKT